MTEQISTLPENTATEPAETEPTTTHPEVDGWRSELTPELQANESLSNFEDINALATGFIETKRMQGNSIHLLGEDASDEQRATQAREIMNKIPGYMPKPDFEADEQNESFYQSIGKPDKADKYSSPEGVEEILPGWKATAYKANLTDAQNQAVNEFLSGISVENDSANVAAYNESVNEYRKEKGNAYEETYRQGARMAEILADKTGVTAYSQAFKEGTIAPENIEIFSTMFDMLGGKEGAAVITDEESAMPDTPQEAMNKIAAINNNHEHAYWKEPQGTEYRKVLDDMMVRLMAAKKVVKIA